MRYLLILFLIAISFGANAQSPFKSQPILATATTPKTDSMVNNYRFGVAVSPGGFTLSGVYQASAGLEFGLQHQDYNYASQTYTVLWSANAVWIPVNTAQKIQSIKDIETFGLLGGIKNNLIQLGPFYNPNAVGTFKDKFGVWFVLGITLNN